MLEEEAIIKPPRAEIQEHDEEDTMALNKKAADRIERVLGGDKFDHRNKVLESELKKSRHRMNKVRNGNGILSVFSSPLSRRG